MITNPLPRKPIIENHLGNLVTPLGSRAVYMAVLHMDCKLEFSDFPISMWCQEICDRQHFDVEVR